MKQPAAAARTTSGLGPIKGPLRISWWHSALVSGTYPVVLGDRGRLVVPVELRERLQLDVGAHLLLVDTPSGVVLLTREQAKILVRQGLSGLDLVGELIAERRRQAAAEDAA